MVSVARKKINIPLKGDTKTIPLLFGGRSVTEVDGQINIITKRQLPIQGGMVLDGMGGQETKL
jgi:hypothetical protein